MDATKRLSPQSRRDACGTKATARDVQMVIPTLLEQGGEYFRELWKSLSDRDRNLLRRLVQGEIPLPQDKAVLRKLEAKRFWRKRNPATASKCL